jgi:hypothetical protein
MTTNGRSINRSVEQVHEVPKSLSARIVVDLYPSATVRPAGLLQGEGDVAKWTPAAGIEEVRLGRLKLIGFNFHRIVVRSDYRGGFSKRRGYSKPLGMRPSLAISIEERRRNKRLFSSLTPHFRGCRSAPKNWKCRSWHILPCRLPCVTRLKDKQTYCKRPATSRFDPERLSARTSELQASATPLG